MEKAELAGCFFCAELISKVNNWDQITVFADISRNCDLAPVLPLVSNDNNSEFSLVRLKTRRKGMEK